MVCRWILAVLVLLLSGSEALAQVGSPTPTVWTVKTDPGLAPPPPPREFRAAWVATVANIDWPSRKDLTTAQQREEMTRILDTARRIGLNALIVQVRPSCDAIYPSALEPWSEYLTGESGKAPAPAYDPLAEWVAGAHDRGLELHAWFNPFRARHFRAERPDHSSHISKTRPELVRSYDNYLWLDPGEPAARAHSLAVILDVVRRYDVDGVHIDDYFYPYPKAGQRFPDEASYARSNSGSAPLSLADWRRDNVNSFVRVLHEEIRKQKPHVRFGISPFGIWRPGFPPGIQGFDAHEGLAADARLWLRKGWLDYAAPQLYWPVAQKPQSYERLLDWWIANNDLRRHIWVGNNTSRILPLTPKPGDEPADGKQRPSWEPAEVLQQIEITRSRNLGDGGASGNIHFSMVALVENRRGIADALRQGPYATPALVPAAPWLAGETPEPQPPLGVRAESKGPERGVELFLPGSVPSGALAAGWVIWSRSGQTWSMSPTPARGTRIILNAGSPLPDAVAVSAIDRFGRVSVPVVLARQP